MRRQPSPDRGVTPPDSDVAIDLTDRPFLCSRRYRRTSSAPTRRYEGCLRSRDVGLRGMPRSRRGLRPSIRCQCFGEFALVHWQVSSVYQSSGSRQVTTRKWLALYILQAELPDSKPQTRLSVPISDRVAW